MPRLPALPALPSVTAPQHTHKVVRLSGTMAADAAFARQLKRKFL